MSESESVFQDESIWDYIKQNPQLVGIQVSERQGLDILNALRDIYDMTEEDVDTARKMMTMLAGVILASAQGHGDSIVNEVLVQEAMSRFDSSVRDMLDEK